MGVDGAGGDGGSQAEVEKSSESALTVELEVVRKFAQVTVIFLGQLQCVR